MSANDANYQILFPSKIIFPTFLFLDEFLIPETISLWRNQIVENYVWNFLVSLEIFLRQRGLERISKYERDRRAWWKGKTPRKSGWQYLREMSRFLLPYPCKISHVLIFTHSDCDKFGDLDVLEIWNFLKYL